MSYLPKCLQQECWVKDANVSVTLLQLFPGNVTGQPHLPQHLEVAITDYKCPC